MKRKRIILPVVVILLLLGAFWLGRISGHGSKEPKEPHDAEVSTTGTKSKPGESASHPHEEDKADKHEEAEAKASGLTLSPEEKANIGLKTVAADLRRIEKVIRVAGVVKPHPDREAQVSSRVSGKVVGLFFKVGDAVQKGQRLAEVQSAEIQKLQVDLIQAENKLV